MKNSKIEELNDFLHQWIIEKDICHPTLKEGILYALESGGKRIRPTLFYTLLEDYQWECSCSVYFAAALECIHTYSLVHDDLPAMDDDDFRRGKPTVHKQFGEDMAILVGDGLLNEAMELAMIGISQMNPEKRNGGILAAKYLFCAAGTTGMIDGQAMDITAGASSQDILLYEKKTGALLGAALAMASALVEGIEEKAEAFYQAGLLLGVSYQMQDDLFDIKEDFQEYDENLLKHLEENAEKYTEKCKDEVEKIQGDFSQLKALMDKILGRQE